MDLHGPRLPGACPGRGCLEALVSGNGDRARGARVAAERPESALGRRSAAGREITGGLVTELAHDGDAVARAVLAEIGPRLGVGLAGVVNIFNPEVIVIGGGAVGAGELLLEPARARGGRAGAAAGARDVRIVAAHFGDEAGMLGAALLALRSGEAA